MVQSSTSFKCFDARPGHTPCMLPRFIDELIGALDLPAYFGLDDLREMAKFGELPNVAGLAAYPIRHPAPLGYARPAGTPALPGVPPIVETAGADALAHVAQLPAGLRNPLRNRLATEPLVMVQGAPAGASRERVTVQVIVPQPSAQLAAAARLLLWPVETEEQPLRPDYTLLLWPEPLRRKSGRVIIDRFIGHWTGSGPDGGCGLAIGYDDPALIVALLLDAARRRWERPGSSSRLLRAGEAVLECDDTIKGDTSPSSARLRTLKPAELGQGDPSADQLAALEPLLVEGESVCMPVWANPCFDAAALARSPVGRRCATEVGAWLYGVDVDAEGRIPLFEPDAAPTASSQPAAEGYVIVPREVMPPPFIRRALRYRID